MTDQTPPPPPPIEPQNEKFDPITGNLKPPTVPLFKIPDGVLNSMSKEASPDLSKFANPVEWIMAQRKFADAQVSGPKENTQLTMPDNIVATPSAQPVSQKKSNAPVVSWAGRDLDLEALTMLFFLVVKEVSKDKKVKKMLKDMNIEIYNVNQDLLWP
jgi:hypothetical protein